MTAISSIAFAGSISPSQPWGYTTLTVEPFLNGRHFHCGIDLPMVVGTPIRAARAGRVGYVGTALVAVETGSQTDWYIHDDHVAAGISVGVHVNRGQLLCYSGNKVPSGGATTGPHTHFEVQNSPTALLRRFIVGPFGLRIPLAIRPGEMNNPATSVDPVPILEGRYGLDTGHNTTEDDMLYVSKFFAKPASLTVFTPGSVYADPAATARVVGALAKGAVISVDGYRYSSSAVTSPDLTASAGAQPGQDSVWWHKADGSGWVPDAIVNTSKLAGAPTPGIPAGTALSNYFAIAGEASGGVVDVAALTAEVVKQLPAYATPEQVKQAIAAAFGAAKVVLPA